MAQTRPDESREKRFGGRGMRRERNTQNYGNERKKVTESI